MMAAKATTQPIPAAVFPKPNSDHFTALIISLVPPSGVSSNATREWKSPLFSVVNSGKGPDINPTSTAAKIKVRKGWSRNFVIPTTTHTTLSRRMNKGHISTLAEETLSAARMFMTGRKVGEGGGNYSRPKIAFCKP